MTKETFIDAAADAIVKHLDLNGSFAPLKPTLYNYPGKPLFIGANMGGYDDADALLDVSGETGTELVQAYRDGGEHSVRELLAVWLSDSPEFSEAVENAAV